MQTDNDDEFRKLMKQKLNQIPVNDDGKAEMWAMLEKRLDEKKEKKKGAWWFNRKYLLLGALFLIISGLSLYYFKDSSKINNGNPPKNNAPAIENKEVIPPEKNTDTNSIHGKITIPPEKERLPEAGVSVKQLKVAKANEGKQVMKPAAPGKEGVVKTPQKAASSGNADNGTGITNGETMNKGGANAYTQKEKVSKDNPDDHLPSDPPNDSSLNKKTIAPDSATYHTDDVAPEQKKNEIRKPSLCFEIGLGINSFSFNNYMQLHFPVTPLYSVFVDIPYGKYLSFSPSLSYISSAAAIQVNFLDSPMVNRFNINALHFIQFGLNGRAKLNKHFSLVLGFGYSRILKIYTISSYQTYISNTGSGDIPYYPKLTRNSDIDPLIKRSDWNINYGIEYKLKQFCIALGGLSGLSDITLNTSEKYHIDNFSLNVSYWLDKK